MDSSCWMRHAEGVGRHDDRVGLVDRLHVHGHAHAFQEILGAGGIDVFELEDANHHNIARHRGRVLIVNDIGIAVMHVLFLHDGDHVPAVPGHDQTFEPQD